MIPVIVLCIFALGLSNALLGPSLPLFAALTGSDAAAVSWIGTARGLGALIGARLLGRLFDRVDPSLLIALLLALCVPLGWGIPQLTTLPLLVLLQLLFGVCDGALHVGANTMLLRRVGARPGPYLNALHAAFGLGATIGPFALGYALQRDGTMSAAYVGVAGAYLVASLLFLALAKGTSRGEKDVSNAESARGGLESAAEPIEASTRSQDDESNGDGLKTFFRLMLALFVIYIIAEVAVSGWVAWYAIEIVGADKDVGAWTTSAFWFGLTCGRLAGIVMIRRLSASAALRLCLIGSLTIIGLILAVAFDPIPFLIAVGALGAMVGPIFPTLMTALGTRMRLDGRRTGRIFAAAAAGGVIAPLLMGRLIDTAGFGAVPWTIAVVLVMFGGGLVVLEWMGRGRD